MGQRQRSGPKVKACRKRGRRTYQLRWRDPITGSDRQQTTDIVATERNRSQAQRAAAELERQLAGAPADLTWEGFQERYIADHLSGLSPKSRIHWLTTAAHVRRILNPRLLESVDSAALSYFVRRLRESGVAETSVDSYLRTLTAALSWAAQLELIAAAPKRPRLRRSKGIKKSIRRRPPTSEEVERMISSACKVRPKDFPRWQAFIHGLHLSGLRLSEALRLSWNWSADFSVVMSGKRPVFRVLADGEKGHQDRLLPMAPEFAAMLSRVPESDRSGRVFEMPFQARWVSRNISAIGRHAGVVVEGTRTATAHDLRRAFGTRWAQKLVPAQLQVLMRHRSIQTTMDYYVNVPVDDLTEVLWRGMGDISGDTQDHSLDDRFFKDHLKLSDQST